MTLSGYCCASPCRVTDSTGTKFLADAECQWCKVHLAMGTATQNIRAVEYTPGRDGKNPELPERLGQIPEVEEIGPVTAASRQFASQSPAGQGPDRQTAKI